MKRTGVTRFGCPLCGGTMIRHWYYVYTHGLVDYWNEDGTPNSYLTGPTAEWDVTTLEGNGPEGFLCDSCNRTFDEPVRLSEATALVLSDYTAHTNRCDCCGRVFCIPRSAWEMSLEDYEAPSEADHIANFEYCCQCVMGEPCPGEYLPEPVAA